MKIKGDQQPKFLFNWGCKNLFIPIIKTLVLVLVLQSFLSPLAQANQWKSFKNNQIASLPLPSAHYPSHQPIKDLSAQPVLSPKTLPVFQKSLIQPLPSVWTQTHLPNEILQHVRIREHYQGRGPKTLVIFEDVHQNKQAHDHFSSVVESITKDNQSGLIRIGLEGNFSPLKLNSFAKLKDTDLIQDIAQSFYQRQQITGPIHGGLVGLSQNNNSQVEFIGVDHKGLHTANIQAYRQAKARQEYVLNRLSELKKSLDQKKNKLLSGKLKLFDREMEGYRNGRLSFPEYVESLSKYSSVPSLETELFLEAYRLEKKINFKKIEQERIHFVSDLFPSLSEDEKNQLVVQSEAYKSGAIRLAQFVSDLKTLGQKHGLPLSRYPGFLEYIQYVMMVDGIDIDRLLTDVVTWEKDITQILATTPRENQLMARARYLHLSSLLVGFSLTSHEWGQYQTISEELRSPIARDLSPFEQFYEIAEKRNHHLLTSTLNSTEGLTSLLIVGGFHTAGITRLCQEEGYSYVVVTPLLTEVENASAASALSVFDREKSSLDKIFSGQKLFLASSHLPPSAKAKMGQSYVLGRYAKGAKLTSVEQQLLKEWGFEQGDEGINPQSQRVSQDVISENGMVRTLGYQESNHPKKPNSFLWSLRESYQFGQIRIERYTLRSFFSLLVGIWISMKKTGRKNGSKWKSGDPGQNFEKPNASKPKGKWKPWKQKYKEEFGWRIEASYLGYSALIAGITMSLFLFLQMDFTSTNYMLAQLNPSSLNGNQQTIFLITAVVIMVLLLLMNRLKPKSLLDKKEINPFAKVLQNQFLKRGNLKIDTDGDVVEIRVWEQLSGNNPRYVVLDKESNNAKLADIKFIPDVPTQKYNVVIKFFQSNPDISLFLLERLSRIKSYLTTVEWVGLSPLKSNALQFSKILVSNSSPEDYLSLDEEVPLPPVGDIFSGINRISFRLHADTPFSLKELESAKDLTVAMLHKRAHEISEKEGLVFNYGETNHIEIRISEGNRLKLNFYNNHVYFGFATPIFRDGDVFWYFDVDLTKESRLKSFLMFLENEMTVDGLGDFVPNQEELEKQVGILRASSDDYISVNGNEADRNIPSVSNGQVSIENNLSLPKSTEKFSGEGRSSYLIPLENSDLLNMEDARIQISTLLEKRAHHFYKDRSVFSLSRGGLLYLDIQAENRLRINFEHKAGGKIGFMFLVKKGKKLYWYLNYSDTSSSDVLLIMNFLKNYMVMDKLGDFIPDQDELEKIVTKEKFIHKPKLKEIPPGVMGFIFFVFLLSLFSNTPDVAMASFWFFAFPEPAWDSYGNKQNKTQNQNQSEINYPRIPARTIMLRRIHEIIGKMFFFKKGNAKYVPIPGPNIDSHQNFPSATYLAKVENYRLKRNGKGENGLIISIRNALQPGEFKPILKIRTRPMRRNPGVKVDLRLLPISDDNPEISQKRTSYFSYKILAWLLSEMQQKIQLQADGKSVEKSIRRFLFDVEPALASFHNAMEILWNSIFDKQKQSEKPEQYFLDETMEVQDEAILVRRNLLHGKINDFIIVGNRLKNPDGRLTNGLNFQITNINNSAKAYVLVKAIPDTRVMSVTMESKPPVGEIQSNEGDAPDDRLIENLNRTESDPTPVDPAIAQLFFEKLLINNLIEMDTSDLDSDWYVEYPLNVESKMLMKRNAFLGGLTARLSAILVFGFLFGLGKLFSIENESISITKAGFPFLLALLVPDFFLRRFRGLTLFKSKNIKWQIQKELKEFYPMMELAENLPNQDRASLITILDNTKTTPLLKSALESSYRREIAVQLETVAKEKPSQIRKLGFATVIGVAMLLANKDISAHSSLSQAYSSGNKLPKQELVTVHIGERGEKFLEEDLNKLREVLGEPIQIKRDIAVIHHIQDPIVFAKVNLLTENKRVGSVNIDASMRMENGLIDYHRVLASVKDKFDVVDDLVQGNYQETRLVAISEKPHWYFFDQELASIRDFLFHLDDLWVYVAEDQLNMILDSFTASGESA